MGNPNIVPYIVGPLLEGPQKKVPLIFGNSHMDSCQNYGPILGTLNNRCRTIIGTQKGTIILTTTYMQT